MTNTTIAQTFALRARLIARNPAFISGLFCLLVIVLTKSPFGDYLSEFTDHLHHTHAAWTFLHAGTRVYVAPFDETFVRYPHECVSWPKFPLVYPPGMFLLFLPAAVWGLLVSMSTHIFGSWVVGYMCIGMLAFLYWLHRTYADQPRTLLETALLAFAWVFALRACLLGFYDGFWVLCGVLSARAYARNDGPKALLWFAAAASLSFRAASLVPMATFALFSMWRGTRASTRAKLASTTIAAAVGVIAVICFVALMTHLPAPGPATVGSGSKFMPISFFPAALLVLGLLASVTVGCIFDPLTGTSMALSSVLTIMHAGHTWHGFVCFPALFACLIAKKRSPMGVVFFGAWFVLAIELAFDFTPGRFLTELIIFFQHSGNYPHG